MANDTWNKSVQSRWAWLCGVLESIQAGIGAGNSDDPVEIDAIQLNSNDSTQASFDLDDLFSRSEVRSISILVSNKEAGSNNPTFTSASGNVVNLLKEGVSLSFGNDGDYNSLVNISDAIITIPQTSNDDDIEIIVTITY